jgi:Holliday junction resolvase RusA-like endonuclease
MRQKTTGKLIVVDCGGKRTKRWRAAVRFAGIEAMDGAPPLRGPVHLDVDFRMPRPAKHHQGDCRDRPLRPNAPGAYEHLQAPDTTKLLRSTEDALKGITWADDKQVVSQRASKRWAEPGEEPGAVILVAPWPPGGTERPA